MIYADNAATTKLDDDALKSMLPWLQSKYGNASQSYSFGREAKKALTEARSSIAKCIGAELEEVYFTSGGSESDNWALKGFMQSYCVGSIITSQIEHHAILNTCKSLEKLGYTVDYLPVDYQGIVLPSTLEEGFTNKTKLVSIMLVNNEIGTIEPIKELAEITHKYGALFHTDAVQAVGHISIDVKKLGIDMLSASAHKFNGPKGMGFLYVKKGIKLNSLIDGGAQESNMRAGTENVAAIVGMATALKKNNELINETSTRLKMIEEGFIDTLRGSDIDFIRNGSENRAPGNVNISIRGANGEMLLHRLDLKGIAVSTGSACDSVNTQVSHVIKAINVPKEYAEGTIRVSFGRNNEINDGKIIAKAIIDILRRQV